MNISAEWQSRISIAWCKGLTGTENCTSCHIAYTGDECQIVIMEEEPGFMFFMLSYQVALMLLSVLILVWSLCGFISKVLAQKLDPGNVANFIIYLNILFCVSRILHYIDPYGFYQIVPVGFDLIVIWVGLICVVTGSVICIAAWLDIILGMKNVTGKNNFMVAKLVTSIISGIFFVSCTFVLFFFTFTDNLGFGLNILNILFLLIIITVLVISFYVIPKVNSTLKKVRSSSRLERVVLLSKAIILLCGLSIAIGLGFIVVNTFMTTNDPTHHWIYFIVATLARGAETTCCILLNLVVIESPKRTLRILCGQEIYASEKTTTKTKSNA